jgi:hypothetical protein
MKAEIQLLARDSMLTISRLFENGAFHEVAERRD